MKNLRIGNYTKFRDISDGFLPSPWRTHDYNFRFCKIYNKSIQKILFIVLFFSVPIFAQNVSSLTFPDSVAAIGIINCGGYSVLVTANGIKPYDTNTNSSDKKYSEYYKSIYGKDAKNPNHIIEPENGFVFIPIIPENQLKDYGIDSLNGFSVDDLYRLSANNAEGVQSKRDERIRNRIINYIKELHENIKK